MATARPLPLDGVAAAPGYRRDVPDGARWKRPGPVLSINGERFFDHMSGTDDARIRLKSLYPAIQ